MNLTISPNINLEASATLAINEEVKAMWNRGETVYHLGFGEARFAVHPKIEEALKTNAHRKAYPPVQGIPELREAVANYYGNFLNLDFSAEQVIIAPGSKALLYAVQMALDADVLLASPSWVSYAPQAQLLHKQAIHVKSTSDNAFALELEQLDEALKRCTRPHKLLIINSPNNPTGRVLEPAFLQSLADYCRKHNIIVMSDEIYGKVTFDFEEHSAIKHKSLASYYPEGTIILGGLSKHLSLGGWRLGKAIIPKTMLELTQAINAIASEIWSAPSAPIQYAAVTAYSQDADIESYINACVSLHAARSSYIWKEISKLGIRCPQPQGAFYMMPDFNQYREGLSAKGIHNSKDLASYLLKNYSIATLPSQAFGLADSELALRLSTSFIDLETDEAAKDVLNHWQGDWQAGMSFDDLVKQKHPNTAKMLEQFGSFVEHIQGRTP